MQAPRLGAVLLWASLGVAACSHGPATPSAGEPASPVPNGWRYEIALADDLERFDVRLCFDGPVPTRLFVDGNGDQLRLRASGPWQRQGSSLWRDPEPAAGAACLSYDVSVERLLSDSEGWEDSFRVGRDVVTRPGLVLPCPRPWPARAEVTVELDLPAGLAASVPWMPVAGPGERYRLDHSTAKRHGRMAFGRFERQVITSGESHLNMVVLDAPHRATDAGLRRWISGAASAVAGLFDGFPVERLQIIVLPRPSSGDPVLFGQATRGGGPGVHLLLRADATDDELPGEWVAVHELIHIGLPWTRGADNWFQEGFTTYYQEVLRARAGFFNADEGWRQIHAGFRRGRRFAGARSLAQESRDMARTGAFRQVYWAGAATALQLDLAIRARWPGERSLDDVMRFLHQRFGHRPEDHEALELLRAADQWLGATLAVPIAEARLAGTGFPEVNASYDALGLEGGDAELRFVGDPESVALREAIMGGNSGN